MAFSFQRGPDIILLLRPEIKYPYVQIPITTFGTIHYANFEFQIDYFCSAHPLWLHPVYSKIPHFILSQNKTQIRNKKEKNISAFCDQDCKSTDRVRLSGSRESVEEPK